MPAKTNVPRYLTGKFNSIAVRICRTPAVVALCENLQSALTSTSANLSGLTPCRTYHEVYAQFGQDFPVLEATTSANLSGLTPCRTYHEVYAQFGQDFPVLEATTDGKTNPSEIRDIFTQKVFRAG